MQVFSFMNLHYKSVMIDKITNHNNTNRSNKPQYKYIRENRDVSLPKSLIKFVNCQYNLIETVIAIFFFFPSYKLPIMGHFRLYVGVIKIQSQYEDVHANVESIINRKRTKNNYCFAFHIMNTFSYNSV